MAEVQAEPVETARSSKAISSVSPSTSAKATFNSPGRRWSSAPFSRAPCTWLKRAQRAVRKPRMRAFSVAIAAAATRHASPMPTIWCVAKVPERMPRSWPPPWICAATRSGGSRRTYSAPMPFGP